MKYLFFLLPLAAWAEPCVNFDSGSCWHVQNQSSSSVVLSCTSQDPKAYGASFGKTLLAGETYSVQFSMGWGDGLGFPEPQTAFTCRVERLPEHCAVQISFETLDWGDRIGMMITDQKITLSIRSIWSSQQKEWSVPFKKREKVSSLTPSPLS